MEQSRLPKPGEIYNHFRDKPYQIITVATHTETNEQMVVYQALYGDFKTYVRPLSMFLSEVDHEKYPEVKQQYRFERRTSEDMVQSTEKSSGAARADGVKSETAKADTVKVDTAKTVTTKADRTKVDTGNSDSINIAASSSAPRDDVSFKTPEGEVNLLLMKFLDANSFSKKLEVVSSNRKYLNDRLINDMAVSLDCTVEEGPLEDRINGLINCLTAICRFENKRLR